MLSSSLAGRRRGRRLILLLVLLRLQVVDLLLLRGVLVPTGLHLLAYVVGGSAYDGSAQKKRHLSSFVGVPEPLSIAGLVVQNGVTAVSLGGWPPADSPLRIPPTRPW